MLSVCSLTKSVASSVLSNRYTAQCLALVSHMTDNQKTIFLKKVLSGDEILHMKMKYDPFFVLLHLLSFIFHFIPTLEDNL